MPAVKFVFDKNENKHKRGLDWRTLKAGLTIVLRELALSLVHIMKQQLLTTWADTSLRLLLLDYDRSLRL